jgi:hypothetical protein
MIAMDADNPPNSHEHLWLKQALLVFQLEDFAQTRPFNPCLSVSGFCCLFL